jgi:hypothetical protein
MQDYERELAKKEVPRREAAAKETAGHEAEAGRALAAGRPDTLRPGAVLHLQRAAGNAGVAQLFGEEQGESPVKQVVGHGGGTPLAAPVRQRMEASFGQDLSDVRIHAGGPAATSAAAVNAHAYTVAHERTLAHELTHVLQQRSGPVDGTEAPGGIRLSSPSDRFEQAAEATAERIMSGAGAGPAAAGAAPAAQRQEMPEEEVQALAIQRGILSGDEELIEPEEEPMAPEEAPEEAANEGVVLDLAATGAKRAFVGAEEEPVAPEEEPPAPEEEPERPHGEPGPFQEEDYTML